MSGRYPLISVVVPCRNEAPFLAMCLDSIVHGGYPLDRLEILVVDGLSEDRTREIAEAYAARYPCITVVDNPRRVTAAALNRGIAAARGELIAWMSAHNRYAPDYLSESVRHLEAYGADSVGGVLVTVPRRDTLVGRAIARALSHRFGVGNSYTKIHVKEPKWVDAVFGGCYRREVFDRYGLFNERLVRGQDMEFHLRMRRRGARILLAPAIVSYYYAHADLASLWRQNWNNGVWAILPFLYSRVMPVSWRHLVPLMFVSACLAGAAGSYFVPACRWPALGLGCAYLCATMAASVQVAVQERDVRYAAVMPVVFGSLHFAYGFGSLWGVLQALGLLISRICRPRASTAMRSG